MLGGFWVEWVWLLPYTFSRSDDDPSKVVASKAALEIHSLAPPLFFLSHIQPDEK